MTVSLPEHVGPWRLLAPLAVGESGRVDLAAGDDGRRVALKRHAPEAEALGLAEADLLGLQHPGLAACLDVGRDLQTGALYTVTDFVAGVPARAGNVAEADRRGAGALILAARLLAALEVVHAQGRLHRDLKADNVLLAADSGRPVLVDFGLSCALESARLRQAAGTPRALAPELFLGAPASVASELWSAGLLLAEGLAGQPLLPEGDPTHSLAARRELAARVTALELPVPAALAALLERLLAWQPERRPESAEAALAALAPLPAALAEERSREALAARLSAVCARHDPLVAARCDAAATGRVFVELFPRPADTLADAVTQVARLLRGVSAPPAKLTARLRQLESATSAARPVDLVMLLEALAEFCPIRVAPCAERSSDPALRREREELARLLEEGPALQVQRCAAPTAESARLVLREAFGERLVLAERLAAQVPATQPELAAALGRLLTEGVVVAGAEGIAVHDRHLAADWPAGAPRWPADLGRDADDVLLLLAASPRALPAEWLERALARPAAQGLLELARAGLALRETGHAVETWRPAERGLRAALATREAGVSALRTRLAQVLLAEADAAASASTAADEAAVLAEVLGEQAVPGSDAVVFTAQMQTAVESLRRAGRLSAAVRLTRRALAGSVAGLPRRRELHGSLIDLLIRSGAFEEARSALAVARAELGADGVLAVREARLLQLRGAAAEALAVLEPLACEQLPREDALLGLQLRAQLRQGFGRLREALSDVRAALLAAGEGADRRTLALFERAASIEEALGLGEEAERHHEQCLALARRLGLESLTGTTLFNRGRALRARGDKRRGLALMEQGAALVEAAGDLPNLATVLAGLGATCLQLGRLDAARRHLARALSLARRLGDEFLASLALTNSGSALAAEGRLEEALVAFAESLQLRTRRSDRRGMAAVRLTRAAVLAERGRSEAADADLREARELLSGLEAPDWQVRAELLEARLALARGAEAEALAAAGAARERAERHAFRSEELAARTLAARAGGDTLDDVSEGGEERGPWLAELLFARAGLRSAAGRADEAAHDAASALSILGETPDGPVEARGLVERMEADLPALLELLSRDNPDYGTVGRLVSRVSRDLDRARALVRMHDLDPLQPRLQDAERRLGEVDRAGGAGLASLAERLRNLERLVELNKALNTEHDHQRLLELIVDSAIELTGAARGFLILFDGRSEEFRAARHIDESTIKRPEFEISHSVARSVVRDGRALLIANAVDDPRFAAASSISELKLLSILCVPLISHERVLGAIYLDHPQVVGRFDERHLETVRALAEQAAIALQNARLSAGLAQSNRELHDSREEIARLNEALQQRLDQREAELAEVRENLDVSRRTLALRYDYGKIITRSPRMHEVLDLLDRITDTDFPVLIQGESGTGKELIARALHFNGPRRERNFVSLNCAAFAEPLIESELFGHVRGAFTGADRDRKGLFEQAHGGTLFLDEIGDMSLGVQKRLLRVLQEGEFLPVGGREVRRVDVRILCATHRDLRAMVADQGFREDLFYRLVVAQVRLPPLRERSEDIALLLAHFLQRHGATPRPIEPEAAALLRAQAWPGNVRELENFTMNLLLFDREGAAITAALVRRLLGAAAAAGGVRAADEPEAESGEGPLAKRLAAYERRLVQQALAEEGGSKAAAARRLGVSVRTFYKMLERLGLGGTAPAAGTGGDPTASG